MKCNNKNIVTMKQHVYTMKQCRHYNYDISDLYLFIYS